MNQTHHLLDALKRALRARGLTYARVAEALGLSEASIKRLFSDRSFSLGRLEQVCDLAGISVLELAEMAARRPDPISKLSPEQERELLADDGLLLMAMLVLNGWPLADILESFSFTEPEAIRLLARLDRMKLIELLPGNRVRRLVARNFSWRSDGPVQAFFDERVRSEFFASRFDQGGEHMRLASGMLSRDSIHRLHRRIDDLVREVDELAQADADLPLSERLGTSLVLAIRPWELSLFSRFRKVPMKVF